MNEETAREISRILHAIFFVLSLIAVTLVISAVNGVVP